MLRLHTFGGCFVARDGVRLEPLSGQRKSLALLAMIASSGDRGISRETVLAYLWPNSDETRARTSLKQLVHSLRRQSENATLLSSSLERSRGWPAQRLSVASLTARSSGGADWLRPSRSAAERLQGSCSRWMQRASGPRRCTTRASSRSSCTTKSARPIRLSRRWQPDCGATR